MVICPVSGNIFYSFDSCDGVDCGGTWWGDRWGLYCTYYLSYIRLDSIYLFNGIEDEYEDEDGEPLLTSGVGVSTYSVGPLKPNISTSFQLGANKVRADVKFKTGLIGFQNHKVRTGCSLGAVKVQPIRSRS